MLTFTSDRVQIRCTVDGHDQPSARREVGSARVTAAMDRPPSLALFAELAVQAPQASLEVTIVYENLFGNVKFW